MATCPAVKISTLAHSFIHSISLIYLPLNLSLISLVSLTDDIIADPARVSFGDETRQVAVPSFPRREHVLDAHEQIRVAAEHALEERLRHRFERIRQE